MAAYQYGQGIYRGSGTEAHLLGEPRYHKRDQTRPGVVFIHGHGGDALQYQPGLAGPGVMFNNLVQAGFVCLSIDAGGPTPWADDDELTAISQAVTYLQNVIKVAGKVNIFGWSMGGLASLNWVKRNPILTNRAVMWAPATDIAYFHANSPGYATEIDADYGGAAGWATNIAGHSPITETQNYRGLPRIRIYQGLNDTTVPPSQTQTFVSTVNDPNLALVTLPTGTHVNLFGLVTVNEVADFLYGRV